MEIANIHQAKSQLSRLVERAMEGEEVIIAKSGRPMVRLVPIRSDVTVHALKADVQCTRPADICLEIRASRRRSPISNEHLM